MSDIPAVNNVHVGILLGVRFFQSCSQHKGQGDVEKTLRYFCFRCGQPMCLRCMPEHNVDNTVYSMILAKLSHTEKEVLGQKVCKNPRYRSPLSTTADSEGTHKCALSRPQSMRLARMRRL